MYVRTVKATYVYILCMHISVHFVVYHIVQYSYLQYMYCMPVTVKVTNDHYFSENKAFCLKGKVMLKNRFLQILIHLFAPKMFMLLKNFVVFLVVEICRHNKTYFLTGFLT